MMVVSLSASTTVLADSIICLRTNDFLYGEGEGF